MVTKAEVRAVRNNKNEIDLYIPIYDGYEESPDESQLSSRYHATICTPPGISPAYQVGDIVFICIEDVDLSEPVIMGLLYPSNNEKTTSNANFSSLMVQVNTKLPADTSIGEVTKENIKCLEKVSSNIQEQFNGNTREKIELLDYLSGQLSNYLN